MNYLILLVTFLLMYFPVISQPGNDSTRVTIQIIQENNGERTVEQRTYQLGEMTAEEQRAYLDSLLNSVQMEKNAQNRRISVTLEEGTVRDHTPRSFAGVGFGEGEVFVWNKEQFEKDFRKMNREMERMNIELRRLHKDLDTTAGKAIKSLDLQLNELWADTGNRVKAFTMTLPDRVGAMIPEPPLPNSSKTVKSVFINPNKPYDGNLNVRFNAREKGDVTIRAVDVDGKEIAKKVLKDFEGEFMGQLELKKSREGVLFVSVTQNNDGVFQRVVIPSEKSEK